MSLDTSPDKYEGSHVWTIYLRRENVDDPNYYYLSVRARPPEEVRSEFPDKRRGLRARIGTNSTEFLKNYKGFDVHENGLVALHALAEDNQEIWDDLISLATAAFKLGVEHKRYLNGSKAAKKRREKTKKR